MKRWLSLTVLLALAGAASAADVQSGLPKGASPDAFNVKDVTGPARGTSLCYRCRLGNRPVTAVFARQLSDELANLVKEVDSFVGRNESKQASAFVVLLSKSPDADEAKVAEFAKRHGIKNVPLTVFDGEAGPSGYHIAQNADVTVNLWKNSKVEANHAYGHGQLTPDQVQKIVSSAEKMIKE